MKYKTFLSSVSVSVLFLMTMPYIAQAQINGPGCYVSQNGIYSKVGMPDGSGYCVQGSNLGGDGTPGTIVPNNLSYTPLEPLPGENVNNNADFCALLNLVFKVLIYLGGTVAVLFLVLGGITYMVSEVVDKRSVARERIKAAVWGLVLLLGAWIILNTVNPQLINACNIIKPTTTGVTYNPPLSNADAARAACNSTGGTIKVGTLSVLNTDFFPILDLSKEIPLTCTALKNPLGLEIIGRYKSCQEITPGQICLYY